ncbi:SDR family NAD(P)-dependent oxidoreductase [Mycolicibacterium phlei]|jgi:2-hydroxycyclohexanecarboxyl-CoA dehydrogenase|uniref:SDR family NAD(P)-dependent oxidoreductase n=1 Tax=Mycolicibacterium phlei TaxID=1771 RepID=UPI00025AD4B4|nr:SDR family oxidoreductase [Mycolicibacterium phlei]EID11738.1 short-chain dehydrogenase [Mycolicibacterium phlei RIVM601174]MBF4193911.1 short-chain dehydrogenase [Mycolicibacterium phlei]
MTARLEGTVALVTGAGQGIGRGIALALARDGASVVLAGRTKTKCDAVAAEIAAEGATAEAVQCDVTVRADVDHAVAHAVATFGGLDILVNNAQSAVQKPITDTTDDDVELCFRSGAMATLYGMQAAYPHLVARKGGSIVNLASSTAIKGDPTFGSYAMAKEAIRGLSRVAVREWGPDNIRVNVIVPAAMSPAAEEFKQNYPEMFDRHLKSVPLQRMGDPCQDIGRAVAALVSDDFSYVTGQTLMLTGGA